MAKVGRSGNLGFRDGPPLPHVYSSHTSAQKSANPGSLPCPSPCLGLLWPLSIRYLPQWGSGCGLGLYIIIIIVVIVVVIKYLSAG